MKAYLYVDWEGRDIILTTSHPEKGKKARKLIENEFTFYGIVTGFNVSTIKTREPLK